jgi:hypothetical protein
VFPDVPRRFVEHSVGFLKPGAVLANPGERALLGQRAPVVSVILFPMLDHMSDIPQEFVHARADRLHLGQRILGAGRQEDIVMLQSFVLSDQP